MPEKIDLREINAYDEDGVFRPEKLALVHVTSYMPKKSGDHYEIQSTAEAIDYMYPRNTIHFTIGHHVDAVFGGSWDNKGIMIVAPLKGTIDDNDKPLGMSSFDTFFETTPGRNLVLPQGTHLFIPTTDPEKLDGKLKHTEGDITYYKSSGYTESEKRRIFSDSLDKKGLYYHRRMFINGTSVDEEGAQKLSDDFIAYELKKNILDDYLEQTGYVRNGSESRYEFNCEGSDYAKDIAELGKKLGCRFCTAGNKGHSNTDFTDENIIIDLYNFMHYADFILHPDEFDVDTVKTFNISREYTFRRKNGKGLPISIWDTPSDEEENYVKMLKDAPDFTEDMLETRKESGDKWTPAFRETYDTWMKKTTERLNTYYAQAQSFDFASSLAKIQKKMKEYDKINGGLLTRSFARGARTPEREKKAQGLLRVLRERDRGEDDITMVAYMRKKQSIK